MKWWTKRQLSERRPLPTGRKEFDEWAARIIQAAALTASPESQKYTLANVIANSCGPAVAFESDAFFINYLRKAAANQVALAVRDEIYAEKQRKLEAEKDAQMADHPV